MIQEIKFFLIGLLSVFMLAGCNAGGKNVVVIRNLVEEQVKIKEFDKKISVICNISDDNTFAFLHGAVNEGIACGYTVDTYVSEGDNEKTRAFFEQAIQNGSKGIIFSHGTETSAHELIRMAVNRGVQVVTFDTTVTTPISGVTQTKQNDTQLAEVSLAALLDGVSFPARIIKIWYPGDGFQFEARNEVYKKMESEGYIRTVEVIQPTLEYLQSDVENVLTAILADYAQGEIDGIWISGDKMFSGAIAAINKSGRTDIRTVTIGMPENNKLLMKQNSAIWSASVTTNSEMIGRENMILLIKKLRNEEVPSERIFDGILYTILDGEIRPARIPVLINNNSVCEIPD